MSVELCSAAMFFVERRTHCDGWFKKAELNFDLITRELCSGKALVMYISKFGEERRREENEDEGI